MIEHDLSIHLASVLAHSLWLAAVVATLAAITCRVAVKTSHARYGAW
jgi:hypothetical protein